MVVVDLVPEVMRSILDDGKGRNKHSVLRGIADDVGVTSSRSAEDLSDSTAIGLQRDSGSGTS